MSKPKKSVRSDLTTVENKEFAAFARRIVRAFSRRVAQGDVEALTDLLAFAKEVDSALQDAVTGLREYGYSWSEIASRAGTTKQTACERWSPKRSASRVVYTVQVSVSSEPTGGES